MFYTISDRLLWKKVSKDWEAKDGGDLVFMSPPTFIAANYNAMTFFPVTKKNWHLVTPVAPSTPPTRKRREYM